MQSYTALHQQHRQTHAFRRPAAREGRPMPAMLGPILRVITAKDVDTKLKAGSASITDCRSIASYNILSESNKQIIVPGRPPLWTPSAGSMTLRPDDGQYYVDENMARFPDCPFEPALRSIFHVRPAFNSAAIDIVACGSTLGNLLRFLRGQGDPFSFAVDLVGSTAFFIRRELTPTACIEGIHGFGHRFVEANTTWNTDVKQTVSHLRLISYKLGSHTIVVRFEADGYTIDQEDDLDDSEDCGVPVTPSTLEDFFQGLSARSGACLGMDLKLGGPQEPGVSTSSSIIDTPHAPTKKIEVISAGSTVPRTSILDIKTRSERKDRDSELADQLSRLWLRQIDNIVLSLHRKGNFGPASIEDVSSKVRDWEDDNATIIAQLCNLIDVIRAAAKASENGKLEVRNTNMGCLELRQVAEAEETKWCAVTASSRKQWSKV